MTSNNFNTMAGLYNALVSGGNNDAVFICSALEEHAKNIPLRNDAILEFYEFALQLFDRVFGEDTTGRSADDLPKEWKMMRIGGWLRKLSSNSFSSNFSIHDMTSQATKNLGGIGSDGTSIQNNLPSRNQQSSSKSIAFEIATILFSDSNLMDILKRGNGYFNLDYKLLPFKFRDILSNINDTQITKFMYTSNLNRLQILIMEAGYITNSSLTLSLPPFQYFLIMCARYPSVHEHIFLEDTTTTDYDNNDNHYNPYHMQSRNSNNNNTHKLKSNMGVIQLLQTNAYFTILRHYLNILLPRYTSSVDFRVALQPESEMFLRMCIEYWIDISFVVRTNHLQFLQRLQTARANDPRSMHSPAAAPGAGGGYSGNNYNNNNNDIYSTPISRDTNCNIQPLFNAISTVTSILYYAPMNVLLVDDCLPVYTTPCLQCTYLLLMHILSDIRTSTTSENLATENYESILRFATEKQFRIETIDSLPGLQDIYGFMYQELSMVKETLMASPLSLNMIQQPLFDMLRTIFSRGEHSSYSSLTFHQGVQIWLMYIQPWSANTAGSVTKDSKYNSEWDFFISANLHFYTTLLGMFLHTVSKISLHPTDTDGSLFMMALTNVLKCFSGELLNTVTILVSHFNGWFEYEVLHYLSLVSYTSATASGYTSVYDHRMTTNNSSSSSSSSTSTGTSGGGNTRLVPAISVSKPLVTESLSIHRLAILIHHKLLFPDFNETCLFSQDAVDLLTTYLLTPVSTATATGTAATATNNSSYANNTNGNSTTTTATGGTGGVTHVMAAEQMRARRRAVIHILRPIIEIYPPSSSSSSSSLSSTNTTTNAASGTATTGGIGTQSVAAAAAAAAVMPHSGVNTNATSTINLHEDCCKLIIALNKLVKVAQESYALWLYDQMMDTFFGSSSGNSGGGGQQQQQLDQHGYSFQLVDRNLMAVRRLMTAWSLSSPSPPSASASTTSNGKTNITAAINCASTSTVAATDESQLSQQQQQSSVDSLDAPLAAYEWHSAVAVTVSLSKYLNHWLQLPLDRQSVYRNYRSTFSYIWSQLFTTGTSRSANSVGGTTTTNNNNNNIGGSGSSNRHPLMLIVSMFRFNFRGLANITLLVSLCLLLVLFILYKWIRGDIKILNLLIAGISSYVGIKCFQMVSKQYNEFSHYHQTGVYKTRNEITGKLTEYGKQQVLSGQIICRKNELKYTGDLLKAPFCSYEIRFIATWLINISIFLNHRYQLPVDKDSVGYSWQIIFLKSWNDRLSVNPLMSVLQCGRVNLRSLSRYYIWIRLLVVCSMIQWVRPRWVYALFVSVCVVALVSVMALEVLRKPILPPPPPPTTATTAAAVNTKHAVTSSY